MVIIVLEEKGQIGVQQEVIMYNRTLSSSEITQVENYLKQTYFEQPEPEPESEPEVESYELSFYMVGRSGSGHGSNETDIKYTINDVTTTLDTVTPPTNAWTQYSYTIDLTNINNLTLKFENTVTATDNDNGLQ